MPKSKLLDRQTLLEKLEKHLYHSGPLDAKSLCESLHISQPAFSRLIQKRDSLIRIGRGRKTLYALHRFGAWGKSKVPVFSVDEKGTIGQVAALHPIAPKGFYLESHMETLSTRLYENLPYFLDDLRPSGFLGRLIPHLYPDLGFPEDINRWTDDDCLLYFIRCGWDLIGNFIIGEASYESFLANRIKRLDVVPENNREKRYPEIADLVLSTGIPGSSATGEQPKFLSIRETKKGLLPVMVKFSPPVVDAISRRIADLLICEHIAHDVLRQYGKMSPRSCLLGGASRLFLEMERFDRNTSEGRRGVVSLRALDLEFVGKLRFWAETAESLFHQKKIDPGTYRDIVWLDTFGRLIGNTDRHFGNISFFCEGEKIIGLAPAYDMLPMMYAPHQNQLVARTFDPTPPKIFETVVWEDALIAARDFWSQVRRHPQVSEEFKSLTADNESKLALLSTVPIRT